MITVQSFMMRLDARYEMSEDGPFRSDIITYLNRINLGKIEPLWNAFIEQYTYNRVPRVADIAKAGREVGIFPGPREKKTAWYVCQLCGSSYRIGSRGCPVCKTVTPVKVAISAVQPEDIILVQTECFRCENYGDSFACGPTCVFYASVNVSMTPEDSKQCHDCLCIECCREERCLRSDEREFRRRAISQRNGSLPDIMGKLLKNNRDKICAIRHADEV